MAHKVKTFKEDATCLVKEMVEKCVEDIAAIPFTELINTVSINKTKTIARCFLRQKVFTNIEL